jgi:hypothetical protein
MADLLMAYKVRDGANALRTVTPFKARDPGGALRTIVQAKVRGPDNVLRTYYGGTSGGGGGGGGGTTFAVSPINGSVSKTAATLHPTPNPKLTRTPSYTLAVAGASAPTFAWSRVSGDAGIVADSPAANPTTFSKMMPLDTNASAIFKCVVTGDGGATFTVFVTVTLSLEWVDIGGTA